MNYTAVIYIILTFVAAYAISGINFDGFIKKGKVAEARVLAISLSFALGYLLSEFILKFLNI